MRPISDIIGYQGVTILTQLRFILYTYSIKFHYFAKKKQRVEILKEGLGLERRAQKWV
jgi:hypothetical protein